MFSTLQCNILQKSSILAALIPLPFFHSVEGVAAYWLPENVPIEPNFLSCLYLHILVENVIIVLSNSLSMHIEETVLITRTSFVFFLYTCKFICEFRCNLFSRV